MNRLAILVIFVTSAFSSPASAAFRTLYMNGNGGTYNFDFANDSSRNLSRIVYKEDAVVPASGMTSDQWAKLMRCTKLQFGRFGLTVTDQDPGDAPHIEAVVGGSPSHIGLTGAGGVAPATCDVEERAVVFIFSEVYDNDVLQTCETTAQEVAHAFGLDHELLCEDPMTYLNGCGPKFFRDKHAPCGEYTQRPCACTGESQNSVQMLLQQLGPGEKNPPQVTISTPADGATIKAGFTLEATATDDTAVAKVELYVDGQLAGTRNEEPFVFGTAKGLSEGMHTFEVRATDAGETVGTTSITLQLLPQCVTDDECEGGFRCADRQCVADLGTECQVHGDCGPGLFCGVRDGEPSLCAKACGGSSGSCPDGFSCSEGGCYPGSGGGGCTVDHVAGGLPGSRSALPLVLGSALVLLMVWWRARRRGR